MEPGPACSFHPGNRRRARPAMCRGCEYPLDPGATARSDRHRRGRSLLASQPPASDFKGSARTETFSVRAGGALERALFKAAIAGSDATNWNSTTRTAPAIPRKCGRHCERGSARSDLPPARLLVPDPVLNADGSIAGAVGPTASVGGCSLVSVPARFGANATPFLT